MTEPTTAIERRDPELDRIARLGTWLAAAESGKDDERTRGMAAALRMHYAEALALPPLAALELDVIKGRIVPSAQLLRALADAQGLRIVRVESSDTSCTAAIVEKASGKVLGEATFTIEQARQAGLVRPGSGWTNYPARMLWARASSWAIRDHAPRVALGMTLPDEVEEATGEPFDVDGYAEPAPDPDGEDVAARWAAEQAAAQEDEAIGFDMTDTAP